MKNKTRKDVAKCLDIGIETLRYYEKMGIMPSPERDENNYRIYSDDAILRLRFILSAKKYGFTLKEIELMLSSVDRNGLTRSGFRAEIQGKIDIIDSKISELMMLKEALGEIRDREDDCEILSQIMKK